MAKLLCVEDAAAAKPAALAWLLTGGVAQATRRGEALAAENLLLVVRRPPGDAAGPEGGPMAEEPDRIWYADGPGGRQETYRDRMRAPVDQVQAGCALMSAQPHTRRFSIVVGRPYDALARSPPALQEVCVQAIPAEAGRGLHLTAHLRSLDVLNYLDANLAGLAQLQREIAGRLGIAPAGIAILAANAHAYRRDLNRLGVPARPDGARRPGEDGAQAGSRGSGGEAPCAGLAAHVKCRTLAHAWSSMLGELMESGLVDRTQWGEVFAGQGEARYLHRCLVDVEEPLEEMLHPEATFDRRYGEDYAFRYLVGPPDLSRPARPGEVQLEPEETYTYASRARYDPQDAVDFGQPTPDQLQLAVEHLRRDPASRRAAVVVSRPRDLSSPEPACLRCYQLQLFGDRLVGTFFMRSNDAYGAAHANQYAFARLLDVAARELGVPRVRLAVLSCNMHVYADSWDAVERMVHPRTPPARERLGIGPKGP